MRTEDGYNGNAPAARPTITLRNNDIGTRCAADGIDCCDDDDDDGDVDVTVSPLLVDTGHHINDFRSLLHCKNTVRGCN
jgi:hypothetical protein